MISVEMLPALDGDCLLLRYLVNGHERRVLIDGGRAGTYQLIRPLLASLGDEPLDALVITHIDQDHILGVLALLDDPACPVTFADIWFNGYHHLLDRTFESFGTRDGERLTSIIAARKLPWNRAFDGRAIEVGRQPTRSDGEPRFLIVAPDRAALENLIPRWAEECRKHGLVPGSGATEDPADEEFERFGAIGGAEVKRLAAATFDPDHSLTNATSIAFLFEHDGKRILFTGDGDPALLAASIAPRAAAEGGRLRLDALKVPHHGSEHNVSRELLEIIDCPRYLISTSGVRHSHPSDIAIARILEFGGRTKELVFNYRSRAMKWQNLALQTEFGYTVTGPGLDDGFVVSAFE